MRKSYVKAALGLAQAAVVMLFVGTAVADHSSARRTGPANDMTDRD